MAGGSSRVLGAKEWRGDDLSSPLQGEAGRGRFFDYSVIPEV